MNNLQEKLDFLLDKYSVESKVVLKNDNTVIADGIEIPIFPPMYERRFLELKNIVNGGTLVGISVMRIARTVSTGRIYIANYIVNSEFANMCFNERLFPWQLWKTITY